MCDKQPSQCSGISASQCLGTQIEFFCPVLCGACDSLTTTTTAKPCVPTSCLNGATFNNELCRCSCFPAYSGF